MGKYLLIYALVAAAFILKGAQSVRKLDPFSVPPPTYNPFDDEELDEKLMELNDLKLTKDRNTDITTRYIWGKQVIKIMNKMTDVTSRQVTLAIKDAFWDVVDSHFGVTRQIVRNTEKNCHSTPRRQLRLRFFYQALLEKTMNKCAPDHRTTAIEIDKDLQPVIRNLTQVFSIVEYCVDDDQRQRIKQQELGITMDLTSRKRRLAPLLVAIAGEIAVEAAIALLDFLIEKLFGWFTELFKCIKGEHAEMAKHTLPNLRDVARRASKLLTETWKKSKDCVGDIVQQEGPFRMQRLVDRCRSSVVYGSNEIRYSDFLSLESQETREILKNQSLVPLPQRE